MGAAQLSSVMAGKVQGGATLSAHFPRLGRAPFQSMECSGQRTGAAFPLAFWQKLPAAGRSRLFDGGWHADVLHHRVDGTLAETQWKRGYDEINEFEAQQRDAGVMIVKAFHHLTGAELERRTDALRDDPWQHMRVSARQLSVCDHRADYLEPLTDQFGWTDTRWAPWSVIDAQYKTSARALRRLTGGRGRARWKMKPLLKDLRRSRGCSPDQTSG